jgi:hypothetical protein
MKIPSNIIKENQYTIGKEFIIKDTYKDYQGYYYELNGKYFIGKKFNINALELIKINSSEVNSLLLNSNTNFYGNISKIKIPQNKVKSIPFAPADTDFNQGYKVRYFTKQININPIFIKEINKDQFIQLQTNSLYQTLEIKYYFDLTDNELNELNKKMPGIKEYLSSYVLPTSSNELDENG